MTIFRRRTPSNRAFELQANLFCQFVDGAHPAFGSALQIGDLQRHFAGEQQCRDRTLKCVSQGVLDLPDQLYCFLVPQ